jgi:hypothetical protein
VVERNFIQSSLSLKNGKTILSCPASSAGHERSFSKDGKMHDDQKKNTDEDTLEYMLAVAANYPDA